MSKTNGMKPWIVINLLLVCCVFWIVELEAANTTKFAHLTGYRYVDAFQTLETSSYIECCIFCHALPSCIAGSFNQDRRSCRLTNTTGRALTQLMGGDLYIAVDRVEDTPYSLTASATQSSIDNDAGASRAIDGDVSTRWRSSSCSHTRNQRPQWWRMDFGVLILVGRVIIYNRSDCCSERLSYLTVTVSPTLTAIGDSANICTTLEEYTLPGINPVPLTCGNKMVGQYLRIYKDTDKASDHSITLCEVIVKP